MTEKACSLCRVTKPLTEFHRKQANGDGFRAMCKMCRAERRITSGEAQRSSANKMAKYRENSEYRESIKSKNRVHRYGISTEEVMRRLKNQGGVCAICGKVDESKRPWAVDHDHSCCSGIKTCGLCVRGILCVKCNLGIGGLEDVPERMLLAAMYIVHHKQWLDERREQLFAGLSSGGSPMLSGGVSRMLPAGGGA